MLSLLTTILSVFFSKVKIYISLPSAFFCFIGIAFSSANRSASRFYKIIFSVLSPFGFLVAHFWFLYLCKNFNTFIVETQKTYKLFIIALIIVDLIYCKLVPEKCNNQSASQSSTYNKSFVLNDDVDVYFVSAAQFAIQNGKISIGTLQRMYKIGFQRAARIMDQFCAAGIVGPVNSSGSGDVLVTQDKFEEALGVWEANNRSSLNTIAHSSSSLNPSVEKIKWYNNKFDYMTGNDFEHYCALVLQGNGYATQITPASGDFGVDIIAEHSGITYAIQCKRYSSDIGVDAVYQVAGGMKYYHANLGIVLTNRYFTRQAQELASNIGVVLWDRDSLIKLIHTSGLDDSSEFANVEDVIPGSDELTATKAYNSNVSDSQCSISQED